MRLRLGYAAALGGAALWFGQATDCAAQSSYQSSVIGADGISVSGTGEMWVRPNLVEIDLHITGKAELTGDALVKYRDAKKRLLDALDKLMLKDLSIEELGLKILAGGGDNQQQRIMNGQAPAASKPQIEVTGKLRARLKNIREVPPEDLLKTVGKLLDVAQDSGVMIGPSPADIMRNARYGWPTASESPARFVVADLKEVREQAYAQAVLDARRRAARLAQLNQVKLGSALSVHEVQVAGDPAPAQQNNISIYPWLSSPTPGVEADHDEPKITSDRLAEVPVLVKLSVRFAIEPSTPATAQK